MISSRPDVAHALGRASGRVQSLQRELTALEWMLEPGESVREVEGGRVGGEAGLLTLTDRRLLFQSTLRPADAPYALALADVLETGARWGHGGLGVLWVNLRTAQVVVEEVAGPGRFGDALVPAAARPPAPPAPPPSTHAPPMPQAPPVPSAPPAAPAAPAQGEGVVVLPGEDSFVVVEQRCHVEGDAQDGYRVRWWAIIRNPRPDRTISMPELRVTARDAYGSILDSGSDWGMDLVPGGRIGLKGDLDCPEPPARIEFTPQPADWDERRGRPNRVEMFPVEGLRVFESDGVIRVTGEIVNPSSERMEGVNCTIALRERSGVLHAVSSALVDLPPWGRVPLALDFRDCHQPAAALTIEPIFQPPAR